MPRPLVIAAQLPPRAAAALSEGNDSLDVRSIPAGFADPLDEAAEVLVAVPGYGPGASQIASPSNWPANIKWVHLLSSGTDGYPTWLLEFARVTTSRGANAAAVAEFAFAAILARAKSIPEIWVRAPSEWTGRSLQGLENATLGLVGCGTIGAAIAARSLAFDMQVLAVRNSERPMPVGVVRADSIADLFSRSDHVVLALPATATSSGIINRSVLENARPGLHLVNVARGAIIDEDALLEALEAGRIGAATLDVMCTEPPPSEHPFYTHPKVRLSAHLAGVTDRLFPNLVKAFATEVARFRQEISAAG